MFAMCYKQTIRVNIYCMKIEQESFHLVTKQSYVKWLTHIYTFPEKKERIHFSGSDTGSWTTTEHSFLSGIILVLPLAALVRR